MSDQEQVESTESEESLQSEESEGAADTQPQGDGEDLEAKLQARLEQERQKWEAEKQEAINKAVQQRLARERRKDAPKAERKEAKPEADDEPKQRRTKSDVAIDEVTQLRHQMALRDALDEAGIKLTKRQKAVLMREYTEANPEHDVEWVKETVEELGFSFKSEPTQPAQQQGSSAPPKQAAPGLPKSDRGTPAAAKPWKETGNPMMMTSADISRLRLEMGEDEANAHIRKMGEEWLKKVRITPG